MILATKKIKAKEEILGNLNEVFFKTSLNPKLNISFCQRWNSAAQSTFFCVLILWFCHWYFFSYRFYLVCVFFHQNISTFEEKKTLKNFWQDKTVFFKRHKEEFKKEKHFLWQTKDFYYANLISLWKTFY